MRGTGDLLPDGPAGRDLGQRRGVDVVELVAPLATGADEPRGLEDLEVLGDRLPGRGELVARGEAGADLEERLAVAVHELVEDRATGRDRARHEHVRHASTIGKCTLARQCRGGRAHSWPTPRAASAR